MMRSSPTVAQGSSGLKCTANGSTSDITSYNFVEQVFPSTYISLSAALATDLGNDNDLGILVNPSNTFATLSAEL